jgi:hypothetical protein
MSLREAGELLEAAGIGFYIDAPGGGMTGLYPADMEAYAADRLAFHAARYGVSRDLVAEFERTDGGRRCSAHTKRGTPCLMPTHWYGGRLTDYDPATVGRCLKHRS